MADEQKPEQSEESDTVRLLTSVCREADETFQRVGGGTRHWVRDCFLPLLNADGWEIRKPAELAEAKNEAEYQTRTAYSLREAYAEQAIVLAEKDAALKAAQEEAEKLRAKAQLLDDIRQERADDYGREAVEACDECGEVVMCSYHSVLSALFGGTWTQPAIDRSNMLRAAQEEVEATKALALLAEEGMSAAQEEIATLKAEHGQTLVQFVAYTENAQKREAAALRKGYMAGYEDGFQSGLDDGKCPDRDEKLAAWLQTRPEKTTP